MQASRNQKLIQLIQKKQKKLSNDEIILSIFSFLLIFLVIEPIYYFQLKSGNIKKMQDFLIITTQNLFFIYNMQIKKIMHIKNINYLTLAVLGNQIILHCNNNQWLRIESKSIINIIGNILLAKQKFVQSKQPFTTFTIHLQIQKSLQSFTLEAQSKKKTIWNIFKKYSDKDTSSSLRRTSFCTIQVNQKNFILEVGKKVYKAIFQNAQLLHISGQSLGFRFDSENYQYQDISPTNTIYWKQIKSKESQNKKQGPTIIRYLRRKIQKNSKYQSQFVRRDLSRYKYNNYSQNIYYALELDTHFQVITPLEDNCRYAQQYLQLYLMRQRSLICDDVKRVHKIHHLSEDQLRSIFYKLHAFIDDQSHKRTILSSLSPECIFFGNGDNEVRISTIFCKLLSRINVDYLTPQQFQSLKDRLKILEEKQKFQRKSDVIYNIQKKQKESFLQTNQFFTQSQVYQINLWKVGMLMYELSYCKLPFPIDYIAYKVYKKQPFKIYFPQRDIRSTQFHHFLRSLLSKNPLLRGIKQKGQTKASIFNPSITNIMQHQWILKNKK